MLRCLPSFDRIMECDMEEWPLTNEKPYFINGYKVFRNGVFYLEFTFRGPGGIDEVSVFRGCMSPATAKGVSQAMTKMISDYEEEYGEIPDPTLHEVNQDDDVPDYKGIEFG